MFNKRAVSKLILVLLLVGTILAAIVLYLLRSYQPSVEALAAGRPQVGYDVQNQQNISFIPDAEYTQGVIVYPGGLVEPESYQPLCRDIVNTGRLCVIARMPFNLAVLNYNAAEKIIQQYNPVAQWSLVGHSLGGSMAARFVVGGRDKVVGLVMLAAYSDVDLSGTKNVNCRVVLGSEDGILNRENYARNKANLSSGCVETRIAGGNHSQFGSYGLQNNDNPAKIAAAEQRSAVVEQVLRSFGDQE